LFKIENKNSGFRSCFRYLAWGEASSSHAMRTQQGNYQT